MRHPGSKLCSTTSDAGFTTTSTDNYDIVKVDLDGDRDYPIYIGTDYNEEEGKHRTCLRRQLTTYPSLRVAHVPCSWQESPAYYE